MVSFRSIYKQFIISNTHAYIVENVDKIVDDLIYDIQTMFADFNISEYEFFTMPINHLYHPIRDRFNKILLFYLYPTPSIVGHYMYSNHTFIYVHNIIGEFISTELISTFLEELRLPPRYDLQRSRYTIGF